MSDIDELSEKLKEIISELENTKDPSKIEQGIKKIIDLIETQDVQGIFAPNIAVIKILLNKHFGLPEIKKEIKDIECKLDDPKFGLKEIKKEIKDIEKKLDDPCFGLAEIKEEVKEIEEKLDNPKSGLKEIKKEIKDIEKKLDNPNFGLAEIKQEIKDIEDKLDNPNFGLAEIKQEIKDIEGKLDNPNFGLAEIKQEIKDIEDKLDNPSFGLAEIKQEIKDIELKLDQLVPFGGKLTTGPVIADNGVNSIVTKVFNNTNSPVTVVGSLFNIGTCPNPRTLIEAFTFSVQPKCAIAHIFPKPSTEWELEYSGIVPNVFVFTAGRANADNAPLSASNLNAANTFRHSEHIPTTDP